MSQNRQGWNPKQKVVYRPLRSHPFQGTENSEGSQNAKNAKLKWSDSYRRLQTVRTAFVMMDTEMFKEHTKVAQDVECMRINGQHLVEVKDKEPSKQNNGDVDDNTLTPEEDEEIIFRSNICVWLAEMFWKKMHQASVELKCGALRETVYKNCQLDWKIDWVPKPHPQQCKEELIEKEPVPCPVEELVNVRPPILPFEDNVKTEEGNSCQNEQLNSNPHHQVEKVIKEEPIPPVKTILIHVRPPCVNFDSADHYVEKITRQMNKHIENGHDFVEKVIKEEPIVEDECNESEPMESREVKEEQEAF